MDTAEEKSLKVVKESIFEKIKKFIFKIFKLEFIKENREIKLKEIDKEDSTKEEVKEEMKEEKPEQELIKIIESEEIKQEELKEEELEKMKEDLSRYLVKIKKEINDNI